MVTERLPLKVCDPGLMTGVAACLVVPSRPKTLNWFAVPTYTFPLTTLGTVNFTAAPGLSREAFVALEYRVLAQLPALCACSTACPPVVYASESIDQTMPCVLPLAEIDGVEPG